MRRLALVAIDIALLGGCSTSTPRPSASSSPSAGDLPRAILCTADEAHTASASFKSFATDVVVGPVRWAKLKTWATADLSGYRMGASENDFKIGAQLRAGSIVTVAVAPVARAYAGLDYGQASGYSPAPAVTFHACVNPTRRSSAASMWKAGAAFD